MTAIVRHYQTGAWVRLTIEGTTIAEVRARPRATAEEAEGDHWIAPAFWDIQTNGRWGISFSDPELTVDQVAEIVHAQAELGTARLCPTLITAPRGDLRHGVRTIGSGPRGRSRESPLADRGHTSRRALYL